MKAPGTKIFASETDLKQLMADVTRAMEKADQTLARIAGKAEAAEPEPATAGPQGA